MIGIEIYLWKVIKKLAVNICNDHDESLIILDCDDELTFVEKSKLISSNGNYKIVYEKTIMRS